MMRNILVAENLEVLQNRFSFEIERGVTTAIVGPNGSGKTTLLRTLLGEKKATGKCQFIDDKGRSLDMLSLPTRDLSRLIAYVPQEQVLPGHITIETFCRFAFLPKIGWFGSPTPQQTADLQTTLAHMGLADLADTRVASLSTGEKQRASLARALLQRAQFLLLDEPTNHLDLSGSYRFWEALDRERERGALTVAVVTHDLDFARRRADRIIALTKSGIDYQGPAAKFFAENGVKRVFGVDLN